MRQSLLFALTLLLSAPLFAQVEGLGYDITCGMRDTMVGAFQPAPDAFLSGNSVTATKFDLRFTDSVPAIAEASMRFAANVWGSYLQSTVPIRVNVDWRDRNDDRLLASAGPSTIYRDFPGAEPDTWYPVALAEAIVGEELNGDDSDISVVVNSTANWNYSTDGRVSRGKMDLATVFLHELGHGLGFLSSIDSISDTELGIGFDNRFIIYDLFLETPPGLALTDTSMFRNPSPELLMAVITSLEFVGENAVRENDGENVPLFAPATFDVGSSVSHLDERVYRAGTENALMTPFLASGEANHDPGPITLGIFEDLGWPLRYEITATREPVVANQLGVFPNPATTSFSIPLDKVDAPTLAILYAADGREARRMNLGNQRVTADFSVMGLSPGVYTLLIPDGTRAYSSRLVIK